jgi:hypothetical protein
MVKYNGNIILMGNKDQITDLWTLHLGTLRTTAHHSHRAMTLLATPDCANTHAQSSQNIAFCMHTVQNKANSIQFSHQSFCSPKISTLLKTICCRYLNGCTNLTAIGVAKYLNPSPATAKGHMKQPRMGICSTQRKGVTVPVTTRVHTYQPHNHSTDSLLYDIQPFSPTNANIVEDNNRL